jgi:hypothetical protein
MSSKNNMSDIEKLTGKQRMTQKQPCISCPFRTDNEVGALPEAHDYIRAQIERRRVTPCHMSQLNQQMNCRGAEIAIYGTGGRPGPPTLPLPKRAKPRTET